MKLQNLWKIYLTTLFLFFLTVINILTVFGQEQQATVLYTDSKTNAETFRAVFVKPSKNNGFFVGLGTNNGMVRYGEINSTVTKLLPKKFMPQDQPSESSVREILFISNDKSYLLKTDGLYQAVKDMTLWEQILSVDDLLPTVKGATPELRTMFLVSPSRMCIAGNYVKNDTEGVIERELLFCNDDIEQRDKWKPEKSPEKPRIAKLQITKLYFSDNGKGWAVGTKGSIWYSDNEGKSWKEQISGTDQHLLSVFGFRESNAWAVGYGGTILELKAQPKPVSNKPTNQPPKNQTTNNKTNKNQLVQKQKYRIDQIVKIKKGRFRQALENKFSKNVELLGKITEINGKKLTVELQKIDGKSPLSFFEKLAGIIETGDFDLTNIELDESEVEPLETEKTSDASTAGGGNSQVSITDGLKTNDTKDETGNSPAWVRRPLPIQVTNKTVILRNVKFSESNQDFGWIVGDGGTILYTVDGGKEWKRLIFSQTDLATMRGVDFYSMFIDEKYCWVVGSKGAVVRIQYDR